MSDLNSLKEKFVKYHKSKETLAEYYELQDNDLLNEAVYGAIYKNPLMINRNDIKFLEQFPPQYYAAALSERYNKLYGKLIELNNSRKSYLTKLVREYLPQEQREINKDPNYAKLSNFTKAHMAKHYAYDRAKQKVAVKIPASSIVDKDKEIYELSLGGGKKISVPAYSYFGGDNGFVSMLEGTPGVNNGYDLFNPRELEDGSKVTDGFKFPDKESIKKMLVGYYNHLANGISDPQTEEEKRFYSDENKKNWKPVKGGVGWLQDTFSKDNLIHDYYKQFYNTDNTSDPNDVKEKRARARANEQFVKNVNNGLMHYSNGEKMYGAKILDGGRVELDSDNEKKIMTVNGEPLSLPISVIKLPHKKVNIDGKEKEVPVLLPGVAFRPVKNNDDREKYKHLLLGRDFLNVNRRSSNDPTHTKIFRKLSDEEKGRSVHGQDIVHSGGVKPTQNSAGVDPISKTSEIHGNVLKDVIQNPNFDFNNLVTTSVDNWLTMNSTQDRRDMFFEKKLMSLYRDDLISLAEIKILKNLGNNHIYTNGEVNHNTLVKLIDAELNRFLAQDLGRGTRRKRAEKLQVSREKNQCRQLASGECGLNYDLSTVLEDYIDSVLDHKLKPENAHNAKELRTRMTADLDAVYSVIDNIRLMYEDLLGNEGAAKEQMDKWLSSAPFFDRVEFLKSANIEVASVLDQITQKVKGPKRKEIFAKYSEFLKAHKLGKLSDFIKNHRDVSVKSLTAPVAQQAKAGAPSINPVDDAVNKFKNKSVDPNELQKSLGNPEAVKQFKDTIRPLKTADTKLRNTSIKAINQIVSKADDKHIPFIDIRSFFGDENIDQKLRSMDTVTLQRLHASMLKSIETSKSLGMHREIRNRLQGHAYKIMQAIKSKGV